MSMKMSLERKESMMARIYQLPIIFGTIVAMIVLIGCGQPANSGPTNLFKATTTSSLGATSTPTRTANPGPVTLQVNAPPYQSKDTITITLNNGSNQAIYFPDHLTNCSVILLLRLKFQPLTSDNGQAAIEPCRTKIVTRIHSLAAGQNLVVRLIAPNNGWLPGIYRATLTYYTTLKISTTIGSAALTVGPFPPQP
jgi:hypothetical protein